MKQIPPVVALMPMKGHSERVKGKNVRPLCGRPMFHWMMDALRGSHYITRILINSDADHIGLEAERLGAQLRKDWILTRLTGKPLERIGALERMI